MAYRHKGAVKFFPGSGRDRARPYVGVGAFARECPKRSAFKGNQCVLTNIRKLKDGGGMATVKSFERQPGIYRHGARPTGTWRLHFASITMLKTFLRGRVATGGKASASSLDGARRRRRRR